MAIEVRPARSFADVRTMLGPKRDPDASVCWCLSHRVDSRLNRELKGRARGEYVRALCRRTVPPGVLAYDVGAGGGDGSGDDGGESGGDGGEVVGWAGVAPRADLPVSRSTVIDPVDDLAAWSVFCVRVRPGHRGEGIATRLIEGAVDLAREHGAPAVEAVPVDNRGERVDLTMAFVGTRSMFEHAGFTKVADTRSVTAGFPRVVMRRALGA